MIFHALAVNREGSYWGETKRIPTTGTNSDSLLNTHSTVEDLENIVKMKLNELGRQKLTRHRSPVSVSTHSIHIKLYSDLLQAWKEGTFDSPGLPPGGRGP